MGFERAVDLPTFSGALGARNCRFCAITRSQTSTEAAIPG